MIEHPQLLRLLFAELTYRYSTTKVKYHEAGFLAVLFSPPVVRAGPFVQWTFKIRLSASIALVSAPSMCSREQALVNKGVYTEPKIKRKQIG